MATRLVVFGGAGFAGRAICRVAVQHGLEVIFFTLAARIDADVAGFQYHTLGKYPCRGAVGLKGALEHPIARLTSLLVNAR